MLGTVAIAIVAAVLASLLSNPVREPGFERRRRSDYVAFREMERDAVTQAGRGF